MRLGERIRELRRQQGLTLRQVSDACGFSLSHLSEIERSEAHPSIEKLGRIAGALGVSVATLTEGVSNWGIADHMLPLGLEDLRADPEFGSELDDDWIQLLAGLSLRGRRPQTRREWLTLYLLLRSFFDAIRP